MQRTAIRGCASTDRRFDRSTPFQGTRSAGRPRRIAHAKVTLARGVPDRPGQHRPPRRPGGLGSAGRLLRGTGSGERRRRHRPGFRVAAPDRGGQRHRHRRLRVGPARQSRGAREHERLEIDRGARFVRLRRVSPSGLVAAPHVVPDRRRYPPPACGGYRPAIGRRPRRPKYAWPSCGTAVRRRRHSHSGTPSGRPGTTNTSSTNPSARTGSAPPDGAEDGNRAGLIAARRPADTAS